MYRDERRGGAPLGAHGRSLIRGEVQEAYDDRELAIVALLPGDPHAVVTFGVPLSYYGAENA